MGALLQNSAIERPVRIFDVEMVVFGTIRRSAQKRTIKVLAQTAAGARRICKWRYRRIEIKSAREVIAQVEIAGSSLFGTLQ
jgi:hypothetical protein